MSESSADQQRLGLRWAFASAIAAALMVIPWKLATEAGEPTIAVLLLLSVAATANSVLAIFQGFAGKASGWGIRRIDVGVAALLASFTLLGNHASALAAVELSPAVLNVLLRTDILFVALLGALLLRERVDLLFWIGTAIAGIGLLVSQESGQGAGLSGFFSNGTGIAIVAAAAFSALTIVTRYFVHRINLVAVNAIRLWMAVALWFPLNRVPTWSEIPTDQILYATLAALVGPFFARLCLMISARYLEARVTTLVQLTAPALTLAMAWMLLGDWPSPRELIGGAIIIAGVAVPVFGFRGGAASGDAKT